MNLSEFWGFTERPPDGVTQFFALRPGRRPPGDPPWHKFRNAPSCEQFCLGRLGRKRTEQLNISPSLTSPRIWNPPKDTKTQRPPRPGDASRWTAAPDRCCFAVLRGGAHERLLCRAGLSGLKVRRLDSSGVEEWLWIGCKS